MSKLIGIGVGPGDPDLLTLKAVAALQSVDLLAFPAPENGTSFAYRIAKPHVPTDIPLLEMSLPMQPDPSQAMPHYARWAAQIDRQLARGRCVGVLCEGDPMFFGSFSVLLGLIQSATQTQIIPGISSINAGAALAGRSLALRNECLTIVPATQDRQTLHGRIAASENFVIVKLGRHFQKTVSVLEQLNLIGQCHYCERVGTSHEFHAPLSRCVLRTAPYFSLIFGGKAR